MTPVQTGLLAERSCAAAQVVLAGVVLLPGHAESGGAAVVGGAVRTVQVQGLHAQPLCLE